LSLAVKFSALILSALGLSGMWYAVFADVGVSVLAILNSMRTLSVKD
jgi:Cd2+/Zn2+-exporting ATPase